MFRFGSGLWPQWFHAKSSIGLSSSVSLACPSLSTGDVSVPDAWPSPIPQLHLLVLALSLLAFLDL